MNFEVVVSARFKQEAKRLNKKYRSLNADIASLIDSLEADPTQGTSLGKGCYKVRLAIASKGRGKSGGGRVITYVHVTETTVYLLSMYDKLEKETVSDEEIKVFLQELNTEK